MKTSTGKPFRGTNLGNWLVLEKWMEPSMFAGTEEEDETWLNRNPGTVDLAARMKEHRETYVTEDDFRLLSEHEIRMVRLPVPYFVFGDCPPFIGCIEYVDKALAWALNYDMKVLIDLHTCPGSQNGYDNGGLTGVCKWCKDREGVKFVLSVLERLAERYGNHPALFGLEVLNEPISWIVYQTAPSTGKAKDKEEAKGSSYVPMSFLKKFYKTAYRKIREHMADDKAIVFHDGFRLGSWNRFFRENQFKNVYLDTHIYIFAMETFVPFHHPLVYKAYLAIDKLRIRHVQKAVPVIVGEWTLSQAYANNLKQGKESAEEYAERKKQRFLEIQKLEEWAWEETAGWYYWNYQLERSTDRPCDEVWKESWDLKRCLLRGWFQ